MAAFDTNRLNPAGYDLGEPLSAINFQAMVKDFMNVVRTNEDFFLGRQNEISRFCSLVMNEQAWPLAFNVVPEFQLPQSHDTDDPTALNLILRAVAAKRPPIHALDPTMSRERGMLEQELCGCIQCIYFQTLGRESLTAEEQADHSARPTSAAMTTDMQGPPAQMDMKQSR